MPGNLSRDFEDECLAEMLELNNVPTSGLNRTDALKLLRYASDLNEQLKDYSGNRLKLRAFCAGFLAGRISGEYKESCRRCGADPNCRGYLPVLLMPTQQSPPVQ